MNVNICHELGEIEESTTSITPKKPNHNEVQKKNLKTSKRNRLQKRALSWTEEAKKATKEQ